MLMDVVLRAPGVRRLKSRIVPRRFTAAATTLKSDGTVTLRDFLDSDDTARLVSAVDDLFALLATRETFADPTFGRQFLTCGSIWIAGLTDELRCMQHPSQRYADIIRMIGDRVSRALGSGWEMMPERSFIRRHRSTATHLPWHIDADAATTAAQVGDSACMNLWLPLDAVGTLKPSLDIVLGSHHEMRKRPLMAHESSTRSDAFVSSIGAPSTPHLGPGDALSFDHFLLHRTQRGDFSDTIRTSCEFRFVHAPRWRHLLFCK